MPERAWSLISDAPLKGMILAREPETLMLWDETDLVAILDRNGRRLADLRSDDPILSADYAQDGSLVALLTKGGHLWLLDRRLEPLLDRPTVFDAVAVAVEPHGRYVAVGARKNLVQIYTQHGKLASKFEPRHAVGAFQFAADRPALIGTSPAGTIFEIWLRESAPGKLDAALRWSHGLTSSVGRIALSGDGAMILAACHNHGVQRYDASGENEGSYHPGGTPTHAVPDFPGRSLMVANLEGDIFQLSRNGQVRWTESLPRPAAFLEYDALGRYLIFADTSGQVSCWDIEEIPRPEPQAPPAGNAKAASSVAVAIAPAPDAQIRQPSWKATVAKTDEEASVATLLVHDDPPRIAFMGKRNSVGIYSLEGQKVAQSPEIHGFGRLLRQSGRWIAAATDRTIALIDARRDSFQKLEMDLVEITHLQIAPDSYGLAVVQECDRVGRATAGGRWIWKRELKAKVEDIAIRPDGLTAITTDDGVLTVLDAAGEVAGAFRPDPPESLSMIAAPDRSPAGVAWITLAHQSQSIRGHDERGQVVWKARTPWVSWQLHRVGAWAMASAPDGRIAAYNGSGKLGGQGRADSAPRQLFAAGPNGEPLRHAIQNEHLIVSAVSGSVRWRTLSDEGIGPIAVGAPGVAALFGRDLVFFPNAQPESPIE